MGTTRICICFIAGARSAPVLPDVKDHELASCRSPPQIVADQQVEEVVVRTLESTPKDATHWRTRSMAKTSGLSDHTWPAAGTPSGSSRAAALAWAFTTLWSAVRSSL
jgi:hypothetical protein